MRSGRTESGVFREGENLSVTMLKRGIAVLIGGISLLGAPVLIRAAPPSAVILIAPLKATAEQDENASWVVPAASEGLRTVLERMGAEVAENPRETPPPGLDPSEVGQETVREWLGPTLSERVGLAVFGTVGVLGEEAVLTLHAVAVKGEQRIAGHEIRGPVEQFPSAVVRGADYLLEAAGVSVTGRIRERAIRDFTTSREALVAYARAAESTDPQEKADFLRTAVTADPSFPLAWMQLGLVQYSLDGKEGAVEAFTRVTELDPDFKEAYNDLGVVLGDEADPAQAIKALRKALDIDDGYTEARFNLAKLLDQRDRKDEALDEYERILKAEPDRLEARFLMALLLDRVGKSERALEEFRYLSVRDPEMAERFFIKKGREARQEKRYEDSQRFFQRARDINPAMPEIYREEGITRFLAGEYEKALALFQLSTVKIPESAEVQHYLGLASVRTGRPAEAEAAFRKAIELERLKESSLELGRLYLDEGRYAEAIASLNRYLKEEPGNEEGTRLLGQATRKAQEDTETMQKKSDFAIRRLDKMEEIVRDLNRRNAELETRLAVAAEQAAKQEMVASEEKRRREVSGGDLPGGQPEPAGKPPGPREDAKVASLESELARERKARQEAEERVSQLTASPKTEGKVDDHPAATQDATESRLRIESLEARIRELEFLLERSRQELTGARQENERLVSEHHQELALIAEARSGIETELATLKGAYEKRLRDVEGALNQERESGAAGRKELQETIDSLKGERDSLSSRLDGEATRAGEERRRLEGELAALQRELEGRAAQMTALQEELGTAAAQLKETKRESDEARETLAAEAAGLRRSLAEAELALQSAGEREKAAAGDAERLRESLAESDRAWQSKYASLQEEKADGEKKYAGRAEDDAAMIKDLQAKLEDEARARQEAEKESAALGKTHRRDLEQQKETLSLVEKLSAEREGLKGELRALQQTQAARQKEAEAAVTRQKEQVAAREGELASAKRNKAEQEKSLQEARITISNLERESADARKRAEAAEGRSSQLQSQLKSMEESLKFAEKKLGRVASDFENLSKETVDQLRELAGMYEKMNSKYKAEHVLQMIVQLQPNDPRGYDDLAAFYYRIGWPDRAREVREKAAALQKKGESK